MTDTLTTTTGEQRLATRMARGAEFLGADMAIMAGAMSWVSERNLVAAISNAGGFGVIACGAMTPALLDAEIKADPKIGTARRGALRRQGGVQPAHLQPGHLVRFSTGLEDPEDLIADLRSGLDALLP